MIKLLINSLLNLKQSTFIKNVITLSTGSIASNVIILLFSPILCRLYEPSSFGILGVLVGIITVITSISSCRYEVAIVLPRDVKNAISLMILSLSLLLLSTVLSATILVGGKEQIVSLFGSPKLAPWISWAPAFIFFMGSCQIFNYWCLRQEYFTKMTMSRLARSIMTVSTQVLGGVIGFTTGGLILGKLVGEVMASFVVSLSIFRLKMNAIFDASKFKALKRNMKKYKKFPLINCPQSLLNILSQHMPVFILSAYFGAETVGLYVLANRLITIPVTLIRESVRQVFYQRASKAIKENRNITSLFLKTTLGLLVIGIFPFIFIAFFAPFIFQLLLGTSWLSAGYFARWLALGLFFSFINPPANELFIIYNKQEYLLIYEIVYFISRTISLIVGGVYFEALPTIAILCCVGAIFNSFLIISMGAYCKKA